MRKNIKEYVDKLCGKLHVLFHPYFVPALYSLIWLLAIVSPWVLDECLSYKDESRLEWIQFTPVVIVVVFEFVIAFLDLFVEHKEQLVSIKFVKFAGICLFLLGVAIVPLYLCHFCSSSSNSVVSHVLWGIAIAFAVLFKYAEMWLFNNYKQFFIKQNTDSKEPSSTILACGIKDLANS